MKKKVFIFSITIAAFSLMAFGLVSLNSTIKSKTPSCNKTFTPKKAIDIFYNVDSRFINHVTREDLLNAKTIVDILPSKATKSIESYQYARVSILDGNAESDASEIGNSEVLNEAQINLLKTTDYSTNIYIRSDYTNKQGILGSLKHNFLTYYITIIPEKEAEFSGGHYELIQYLKENSKNKVADITEEKLQPCRVNFTVTKEGKIEDVILDSTSGYPSVDDSLVDMITNMANKWEPATNSKGEKVDQKLVFFFGKAGC